MKNKNKQAILFNYIVHKYYLNLIYEIYLCELLQKF